MHRKGLATQHTPTAQYLTSVKCIALGDAKDDPDKGKTVGRSIQLTLQGSLETTRHVRVRPGKLKSVQKVEKEPLVEPSWLAVVLRRVCVFS